MRTYPECIWYDEENVKRLREWWEVSGYTTSKIAEEFGKLGIRVGRNSVVGKVNRLKLKQPEWKAKALKERQREIMKTPQPKVPKPKNKVVGKQILIFGKKYNLTPHKEVTVTDHAKPDGTKAVLIKDLKDGMCRAILGYQDGLKDKAVYCGEPAAISVDSNGRQKASSWCSYHKSIYTTEPRK